MTALGEMEDSDNDLSDGDERHLQLADAVAHLDNSQRVKPATRRELSSEVSEFNLLKTKAGLNSTIHVNELAAVLGQKAKHGEIGKKVKTIVKGKKTLPKPVEAPAAQRIKRSVAFEQIKKQLNKWEPLVERNRLKDYVRFPLRTHSLGLQDTTKFLSRFKTQTPLEKEIALILNGGVEPEEMKDEEEEFPLSIEEMVQKRKEMAYLRAKQSYREAKYHQQKKIKSKKFHRIQRREKIKQQIKEFELLQKTNPEAALKKLEELDQSRALERASLRHKNTGQWAQNLAIRAKYDVESRKALAEQLTISKELSQKIKDTDSSDEEEMTGNIPTTENNPWTLQKSSEVEEFISGYRKFWDNKNTKVDSAQSNGLVEEGNGKEIGSDKETPTENIMNGTILENRIEENANKIISMKETSEQVKENNVDEFKVQETQKLIPSPEKMHQEKIKYEENIVMPKAERIKSPRKEKNTILTEKLSPKKVNGEKPELTEEAEEDDKKAVFVQIFGASGAWIVKPELQNIKKKKRKEQNEKPQVSKRKQKVDLDEFFDNAETKLVKKMNQKVSTFQNIVKNKLNSPKNVEEEKKRDIVVQSLRGKQIQRPDEDVELSENAGGGHQETSDSLNFVAKTTDSLIPVESGDKNMNKQIDPNKFLKLKPKDLKCSLPDNISYGDEDDDEQQQMTIMEAFVDDDVVEEFKELKNQEEKSTKPEEINLTLPGWGEWTGKDIAPSKRKKKFVLKPTPVPDRKDKNRTDIIINEEENLKIKEHMVKDVPFPFTSTEAFESSIRAPIGRDWVPESAHRKLIKPSIKTQMGSVIEPITEDELIQHSKKRKSVFKGKVKEKKRK